MLYETETPAKEAQFQRQRSRKHGKLQNSLEEFGRAECGAQESLNLWAGGLRHRSSRVQGLRPSTSLVTFRLRLTGFDQARR